MARQPPRVFIGLTEVSGYYASLRRGFEALGIPVVHVPLLAHSFGYDTTRSPHAVVRFAQYCVARRVSLASHTPARRLVWLSMVAASRMLLFAWAVAKFDVFILGGGSSFFGFRELPVLRLLGKKLLYTFHGTDARPAYIDGFFMPGQSPIAGSWHTAAGPSPPEALPEAQFVEAQHMETARRKAQVQAVERHAHAVICFPTFAHFMRGDFVSYLAVGIPMSELAEAASLSVNKRLRVVHAPSEMRGKGTAEIREAVKNVRLKGIDLDYREISGRPNSEVLEEIRQCDFVIDQAYSDSPMAGFAAEAASLGKPAVVGSHYHRLVQTELPPELIPPTLCCDPPDLEQAIERLARDLAYRAELGARAASYVRSRWPAREVAARYLRILEGDVPEHWRFCGDRVRYLHGIGLSDAGVRSRIRSLLKLKGVGGLQLADKPELERLFVEFAEARSA